MGRLVLKGAATMLALAVLALAALYVYGRHSLPLYDGELTVAGIGARVEIVRDADAIPHVFGATIEDALFGLGYVHAQDRLWQMELQRRIGFGRLSEVLGPIALPQDRFLRTVGFGRAAQAAWDRLPDWATQRVNAYVAGVNAFIGTHHGRALPPEFSLLRFEPEPWTGPDVLVWVKMMAWDLSANYAYELLRHDLVGAVGRERMAELMPPYATDGLSILSGATGVSVAQAFRPAAHASRARRETGAWAPNFASALSDGAPAVSDFLRAPAVEGLGSNNWVVDGTMTASGKPLLANDPHLSTRVPSTWYLAHVSAGDFDVIGATLPGTPAVALGRNRFIAWGATNVAADVEDLYREHVDPTGRFAEFEGAEEPMTIVHETIRVKGAAPVQLDVRVTRHGPIVSDAINAINARSAELRHRPAPAPLPPLAFRWTALDPDDSTISAFLRLNEARNWDEFTSALRGFVVPSQNFVYADAAGHIGYYAPGRIPIRAHGDGSIPADGWTGEAEWTGWISFDALPHAYDPPSHLIVTANNRPEPPNYRYLLGLEWPDPYRAQRVTDLLRGRTRLTPDDFARMQADTLSLNARTLVPALLAHANASDETERRALELLRTWRFDAGPDSGAEAVYAAWFHYVTPRVVGDDLGPAVLEDYAGRFSSVTRFLLNTLRTNDSPWCDDRSTPARETCDQAVSAALQDAVADLTRRMGGDVSRWRWDAVHRAVFPHQLGSVAVLGPLLNRAMPDGGDWSTVDVGTVAADRPYEQHAAPGYRQIIDLSPANDSRFIADLGESGHPLSPHYDDFLPDWRAVHHRRMRMDRADIERGAIGHLTLKPK